MSLLIRTKGFDQSGQVVWNRRGELQRLARGRVIQTEHPGVQGLTWKRTQALDQIGIGARWQPAPGAVTAISDQWVADAGQMNPDLVCAPGGELRFDQRVYPVPFLDPNPGQGRFTIFPHGLPDSTSRVPADGRIDVSASHHAAFADRQIPALDGSVREQVLNVLRDVQADTGLSIIFISHDLAVVRSISHRVLVMYLGRLVEMADSQSLFAAPRHPYTRALLDSVPVPDPVAVPKRAPLRGEVPSPVNPPTGCVFHPRCPKADARCASNATPLRDFEGVRVACHYPNA